MNTLQGVSGKDGDHQDHGDHGDDERIARRFIMDQHDGDIATRF